MVEAPFACSPRQLHGSTSSLRMDDIVLDTVQERQRLTVLHKQLVISIKFHHSGTLKELPLEMALQAMMEVWKSCNPDNVTPQ